MPRFDDKFTQQTCFCILLMMLVLAVPAGAQVITGTILGTVRDPSGGVIPNAQVAIRNTGTNITTNVVTGASGEYTVPLLPPGTYEVTIQAAGFRPHKQSNVVLTLDAKYRVDAALQIGPAAEAVEVVANAQALQTDATDLNTSISSQSLESMPNIGRNPLMFVSMVAGVVPRQNFDDVENIGVGDDSRARFTNFSVNGSRPVSSEILLDGAPNTGIFMNEVAVMPNVSAVGEMKIISNAYSAEFGRAGGGVVSFGTRSGTNQFHGSVYEYFRNPVLNANTFANNSYGRKSDGTPANPKGKFNLNQFGGSASGPVVVPGYDGHNKTFFFFSYEGVRRVSDASAWLTVPTALQRAGDFSETRVQVRDPSTGGLVLVPRNIFAPFPDTTKVTEVTTGNYRLERTQFQDGAILNKIPQRYINKTAQKLLGYYPLPNSAPQQPDGTQNYFDSNSARTNTDQIILKLDQDWGSQGRMFFRYTQDWTLSTPANRYREGNPAVSSNLPTHQFNPSFTLGYTRPISARSMVDIRANATRLNLWLKPEEPVDFDSLGFSKEMQSVSLTSSFPLIGSFSGYQSMGLSRTAYRDNHSGNFSLSGSYTKILDRWTLKVGGEYRAILANLFQPVYASMAFAVNSMTTGCTGTGCPTLSALNSQGYSTADFLIGALDGAVTGGQFTTGDPALAAKFSYWGFYSQNDWKATRRLTVNLGLRWDLQVPMTERYNRLTQFNQVLKNATGTRGLPEFAGVDGNGRGQGPTDLRNWGPRIGLAYRLTSRTVIRSAYGISYDQITGVGTGADGFGTQGFSAPSYIRIRPQSGLDILERPFNDAFNGGGTIVGANAKDTRYLGTSGGWIVRQKRTPYIQQWNFTIEPQVLRDLLLQVAYVGSKGTRLTIQNTMLNNTNSIPVQTLLAAREEYIRTGINPLTTMIANPFYGIIPSGNTTVSGPTISRLNLSKAYPAFGTLYIYNLRWGSSSYNGLQVSARKAFRHGYEVTGNYTWAKSIDFGNHFSVNSGNTANGGWATDFSYDNYNLDRSVSNSDIKHRAVITFVAELPFGKGKRFFSTTPVAKHALGGWKVSAINTFQGGLPISVTGGPFNSYGDGRVDLIGDPVLPKKYRCTGDGRTACPLPDGTSIVVPNRYQLYFNPHAFSYRVLQVPRTTGQGGTQYVADPYWWGTSPRYFDQLRGWGILNTDLSLSRVIRLHENTRLTLKADATNAFNHPRFGDAGIVKSFGSPNLTSTGILGSSTSSTFGTASLTSMGKSARYMQISATISF